jgi:hypothetical protein
MNLIKLSRIISLVSFSCVIISFYLLIFEKKSATVDELVLVILVSIVYLMPILIFNYVCFREITFWIKKTRDE